MILLLLALNSVFAGTDYIGPPPKFGSSPRVAISASELASLKASPDFAAQYNAATNAAQPLIRRPIAVPEGYGGWSFDYACPDDGTDLRAITPKEHECPKCKKHYTGDREVIAYRALMHYQVEHATYKLAWAYALSGDEEYAKEVKRILLKLADDYHTYPARRDRWGHTGWLAPLGGRRYVQSLDESVGAIELAKAYDSTRTAATWSDAERAHVEKDFFRATAESLQRFTQPHNHQTWYNAGLIAIASALGDGDLLMKIVTMHRGVVHQLGNNVGSDGLWNEGTMAYHNYALQPMVQIADMTRRLGMNLHEHPKLRAMIVGPLHAAYPNGQFPAINDSDRGNVSQFQWAFDWAKKTHGAALDTSLPKGSESLNDVGLAVLRVGEGTNAACAFLDFGPHGGGHGHFDKLNLMLYANGREWLLDPGRLTYSHKEYKTWVKTTAAHNTVTIGGESQAATTGKLLWLKQGDGWAACGAESDGAYPRSVLRRYLLLTQTFLVDVFDVRTEKETQIDWFAHAVSDKVVNSNEQQSGRPSPMGDDQKPQGESPVGDGLPHSPKSPGHSNGYQHLTEAVTYESKPPTQWDFVSDKTVLRLWMDSAKKEQILIANGIGYAIDQKVPCLIRRRYARATRFVTLYDLSGNGGGIKGLRSSKDAVEVETPQGKWSVGFATDGVEVLPPK